LINPTICGRINITMCGGGGSASDTGCEDDIAISGGGGAACIVNKTLDTSRLPSIIQLTVGEGGSVSQSLVGADGQPSIIFIGTSLEMVISGGKAGTPDEGGTGGGFPSLPGGSGGRVTDPIRPPRRAGNGTISGTMASGGGGGYGFLVEPGRGGSVGDSEGGQPLMDCSGGGGASLLGRGAGGQNEGPGIGGGGAAASSGNGGDGIVLITLFD
jgi:hypothetical protein